MVRRLLSLVLAVAIVSTAPGAAGWVVFAQEVSHYDPKSNRISTSKVTPPKVEDLLKKLDDPALRQGASKEQIEQMRGFLTRFKSDIKDEESPDAQAALAQLTKDLDDKNKDVGLTLAQIYDKLSPTARKATEGDNFVQVLNSSSKSQTVRVTNSRTGYILFTQHSAEIAEDTYKKVIKRPDPDDPKTEIIDAIVIETKKGAATEQRVLYNRRIELLLKNLKKLYYDQPSLARKIKDNCNVADPANHGPASSIAKTEDPREEGMTDKGCQAMVKFFDGKRENFRKNTTADGFNINILQYLDKLDKAAKAGTLDKLDWKELQAVQRKAMQFYNDNQLETMQKMVLMELKNYFSQVTNATVKESKNGTENLDATMKDLKDLQKVFDEFKKGNFEGYSWLMTTFFAKSDIEDPRYVSRDIMLLASEAFADVANAVKSQQRLMQGGLSGEELDATIEESQQWLKLAQVHLQEFDMHTLAIQLERLQSGHLRDHLGLRKEPLKFTIDGKEVVLDPNANAAEAARLVGIARTQYLPKLDEINAEIKANLIKQSIAGFYLTYQNVTRAFLYDETMQERVRTLSSKVLEMKDLYLSLEFDRVKNDPKFKGKTETEKLKGNLYELYVQSLPKDYPAVAKNIADMGSLILKFRDLAQIQSAERVREESKPLLEEFIRLEKLIMSEVTNGKETGMPVIDDVRKEAQNLGIKQTKLFGAVQDFSAQARIYDMMNELDLYVCKYASSETCYSKGDTALSKAASMKWWDRVLNFFSFGHRDDVVETGMKINPLTEKAFKMLGENKDERHRILLLLSQGKYEEAINRIAGLDPNHKPVDEATKALRAGKIPEALAWIEKLSCKSSQKDAIKSLISRGKIEEAIALLRKLDGALRAMDEYEADKAFEDPFEMLDFDSSVTKAPENKSLTMAQGVIQNMFGQLRGYIMGYTLTAAVWDTAVITVLTLGMGAASRYAIGIAKGIVALGMAMQAAKAAEAVGEITRMARVLRILANIGKWIISVPGKIIVYVGKWLESSMISIRNTLGIANISKNLSFSQKTFQIVRIGTWNALKFNVKNTVIMGGASAVIQAGVYMWNPESSQYQSVWEASKQGLVSGVGFGAKSSIIILMSPVPVSAFGEGTLGNVVRTIADSPGPMSSMAQGVAKVVASDSVVASQGVLGWAKDISLTASPGWYAATKALVWGGAMLDGMAKYMLASAVAHNIASVGEYYEYKITHAGEGEKEGATIEMQALSQGEAFGMSMAELSWLLLPVHQQSNNKSVTDQINREDLFNAAVNQGLTADIAQARNGADVFVDKPWSQQTVGEKARGLWAKATGAEYEPPKGRLNVDADLRAKANKYEMKTMTDAQLLDIATTPRENIGKYRLKAELGADFGNASYSNEPIRPEGGAPVGASRFSKSQGGEVDLRDLNVRVTDEAITTAKDMLTKRLKGDKGSTTRLEILRAEGEFTFNKGKTDGQGNSLEVTLGADRLGELKKTVANIDLLTQGKSEKGTMWQKLKDMVKGRPLESPSEAMVRNFKEGVKAEATEDTKTRSQELDAAAKEVKEAAAALKEKAEAVIKSRTAIEGTADQVKDVASKLNAAADRLDEAASKLNDPRLKQQAKDLSDAARRITEMGRSDKLTPEGVGERDKDVKRAARQVNKIADAVDAAAGSLRESSLNVASSEVAAKAIDSINGQMETRITTKMAESTRLRAESVKAEQSGIEGRAEGLRERADALEREARALQVMRKSLESDALLRFANERMAKDFEGYRSGTVSKARIDQAIDLFVATWEKGVFGEHWGTFTVNAKGERVWTIKPGYEFVGRNGGAIPEFRGPQKAILKEILTSMAEGHQMTMGLLKTSGGKTLLSFVLLSFMDTLARQKGKQGAVYVTVNGDLVAQAYEDYRAFFKGRDPSFEIRTISDFMADQAMADATGGMSPFTSHDVVFDEYDLLGTVTALSLGSDNGRLSHPELDPVQKTLHQGALELKAFFDAHPEIGTNVDGGKLMEMVNAKDGPYAKFATEFANMRAKYVKAVNGSIAEVRTADFKAQVTDVNSALYKDLGITSREQFQKKYAMSPEQLYKEMRDEHDHAFGGGWRKLWDVGVINRQHGGIDGYITKTFLGGLEALSKPDIAKYYDAQLDPEGKKLVQYHNDVPLDNLDTLYRSYLELKHGIPLTLDFDNLTIVDFAGLNQAAKKSGANVVAVSGTLPDDLRTFMKDLGWNIKGEANPGQALNYQVLDPIRRGVRETIGFMKDGKIDSAMSRIEQMGVSVEGQTAVRDLLKAGKLEAAVLKLAEVAPGNTIHHEVISGIHDLTADNATRSGPRNLGLFFAESKTEYGRFEAEMDALNSKFIGDKEAVARYTRLNAESTRLAGELQRLRGDRNAVAEFGRLKGEYSAVEGELDPLRTIPRKRRVVAVTPDSNFLVQEWLMPEAVEAKNLKALEHGDADVVILIGQSGFRGLDLPFKASGKYDNGHISMYIADPGSLSTVNRRQLTGRIDTGRMPKGATSEVVGLVRDETLFSAEAYKMIARKALSELAGNGQQARWNGIQSILREHAQGRAIDEAFVRDFIKTAPDAEDPENVKAHADVRYLYQDFITLRELAKVVKPEEAAAALKSDAEAAKLALRPDVAKVLLDQDALQSIMAHLQAAKEHESLESSGIFKKTPPSVLQQLLMRLRGGRVAMPQAVPAQ
ncbi:MAG: hypothetical protein HY077_03310 [Elusimicrobia bacterium]|nr:hypothetical protein [Elusimicrobiota bacterium]